MSQRRTEAFLLRLVVQEETAELEQWRGRVQHVSSGDEQMFRTLPEALAFIRDRCERFQSRNTALDELSPPFP